MQSADDSEPTRPDQRQSDQHGTDQHRPRGEDQVYGITTADSSHTDDITRRQKQYVLTMLVRIVSIVIVVSVPGISWPVKIGLCFVATIIPYIAVVRANGGPAPQSDPTHLMIGPPQRPALDSAQPGLPGGVTEEFLRGEYIRGEDVDGEHAGDKTEHGAYSDEERVARDASDIGHTNEPEVSQSSMNKGGRPAAGTAAAGTVDQRPDQAVEPR